jgi:hypothetical protein
MPEHVALQAAFARSQTLPDPRCTGSQSPYAASDAQEADRASLGRGGSHRSHASLIVAEQPGQLQGAQERLAARHTVGFWDTYAVGAWIPHCTWRTAAPSVITPAGRSRSHNSSTVRFRTVSVRCSSGTAIAWMPSRAASSGSGRPWTAQLLGQAIQRSPPQRQSVHLNHQGRWR